MDVSQCQLLEKKAGEGKAAKAARILFGPPAAPAQGKGLGPDQCRECLVHAATLCSSPMREDDQDNYIQGTVKASKAEPSGTN